MERSDASPGANPSATPVSTGVAAALAWWRDAGVDCDFTDRPVAWLAPSGEAVTAGASALAPPPAVPDPVTPLIPFGGDPAGWPARLADFAPWWLAEPALDDGQVRDRVPPRGVAGARLMVLVPQPEPGDSERLLSGPEGRLLDAILGATGLGPDDCYVAAVLPRHTPLVDWAALARRGAGAVLARHVRLVAPQRLVAFGSTVLPLLGHDPTHSAQILHSFNHEDASVPLFAARDLGALLARPAWKAGFWRTWLDWTGQETA